MKLTREMDTEIMFALMDMDWTGVDAARWSNTWRPLACEMLSWCLDEVNVSRVAQCIAHEIDCLQSSLG